MLLQAKYTSAGHENNETDRPSAMRLVIPSPSILQRIGEKERPSMGFAFWFSAVVLLVDAALLIEVIIGARKIGYLRDVPAQLPANPPKVSIIVSALNEADTIAPALQSLLALDYPDLEFIAIDDRSTDATPAILDRMAAHDPRVRVLHISELPPGWLGKNHALHRGAELASGDYLLFTDADVIFDRSTIARAVTYCERHRVDHLTMMFRFIVNESLLGMLIAAVLVGSMSLFKPWKVASSNKYFMGIGAFNLVRTEAYRAVGGHSAIALEVIDDMMLGKLLKENGCRQQFLHGMGLISLEWYRSAGDMMRGMEKNAFAGLDYNVGKLIAVTLAMLMFRIWPWLALLATAGATRWLNAATILIGLIVYADVIRRNGWRYRSLLYAPLIAIVELWMWWRAYALIVLRGGIVWRGTHYSLDALRRARRKGACY
jgi:glycosyltransferase involved in cell wall biosynthesis